MPAEAPQPPHRDEFGNESNQSDDCECKGDHWLRRPYSVQTELGSVTSLRVARSAIVTAAGDD
jgi:hypothetical protein